jgi:hypothetical protein
MIAPNSIVALKKGHFEELYECASSEARALVVHSRVQDGIEEIYVDWDRDHWRTNGEEDMWTYANHFEVLEAPDASEVPEEYEDLDDFIDALEGAINMASAGEGFLLLSLQRDPKDGELFPQVVIRAQSEEAEIVFDREILPGLGFDE